MFNWNVVQANTPHHTRFRPFLSGTICCSLFRLSCFSPQGQRCCCRCLGRQTPKCQDAVVTVPLGDDLALDHVCKRRVFIAPTAGDLQQSFRVKIFSGPLAIGDFHCQTQRGHLWLGQQNAPALVDTIGPRGPLRASLQFRQLGTVHFGVSARELLIDGDERDCSVRADAYGRILPLMMSSRAKMLARTA